MIHLSLTLESPLIISKNRVENLLESSDYISGSALRGALANAFFKFDSKSIEKIFNNSGYKSKEDIFRAVFLSGKVRFGNCYLGTENVSVLPATVRSCKSFSGFIDPETDQYEPKHGVLDGLIRYYAYRKNSNKDAQEVTYLEHLDECQECGSPVEQFSGVYAKVGDKEQFVQFEPRKSVITRTALDEHTQTAKSGSLFSTEVLLPPEEQKGYHFHGKVFVSDSELEKSLTEFFLQTPFSIGGERTYGYGSVNVIDAQVTNGPNDLEARFDNFNTKLKEILPNETALHFVLTLDSDAILMDNYLRFVSTLDENILKSYFPADLSFNLVDSYCSTRLIQGWSNVHKLPKENDLAVTRGSVFLFKTAEGVDKQELIKYLSQIETDGIGQRKIEGFGEVIVCNPFHLEVIPK